jgi:hypothetical protein
MYKAPTAEQVATLRERAVQFRLLARNQDMIAARLIAAAATWTLTPRRESCGAANSGSVRSAG